MLRRRHGKNNSTNLTLYRRFYMSSDTEKEYNIRLNEVRKGKLSIRRVSGSIKEIIHNEYGSIFTLKNKIPVFRSIIQLNNYQPDDQIYLSIIFIENDQELFVFSHSKIKPSTCEYIISLLPIVN